ncbi:MAG TPA: hypothetical protein VE010_13390 [Thermoanaerobaculia bacterium]|nr:hypothetical protein [Thermoanaerobaculia bacterium]
MIDITEARVFYYDDDRRNVTVYRDFTDTNLWYIVPSPRFARNAVSGKTLPAFSLTEFETNEGARGTCAFTVELAVSPDDLAAARANLPPGAQFGQFQWVNAESFLRFQLNEEEVVMNVVPSLAGSNEATFVAQLRSQQEVEVFKAAFGPGSAVGANSFRVDYQVLTLSKLVGIFAKVTYESSTAVEYERTVSINKNVWGQETSRRATVQEYLRKSDAGKVEITPGTAHPSDELKQRANDWAFVTLEGLVTRAMDDAMRAVGERNFDNFSLTSVASFERTYQENQVIEWAITPGAFLTSFTPEEWAVVYRKVENRRLVVNFTILDNLADAKIESVLLTVHYPTASTNNTYRFTPGQPLSWTFDADGTPNVFDPKYEYEYTVTYADPAGKQFKSERIPSVTSKVDITIADLGVQTASFIGSNIDFVKDVDFVLIDFFFHTPGGLPNTVEQVKMTNNLTPIVIPSRTFLPSANEYSYQLTYVLKNKVRLVVAPQPVFAPQNRALNTIVSPFVSRQANIYISNPTAASPKIVMVEAIGQYRDPQNDVSGMENGWTVEPAEKLYTPGAAWTFSAVPNATGSYIVYNGTLFYDDGDTRTLQDIAVSGRPSLILNAGKLPFSVEVNPYLVDWDGGIQAVEVTMFLSMAESQGLVRSAVAGAGDETQRDTLIFQPRDRDGAGERPPSAKQYYTFDRMAGEPVRYYHSIAYRMSDGTTKYVATEQDDNRVLVLPRSGTATSRIVNATLVEA